MSAETNVPHSIGVGEFTICGVTLRCHVLDNGARVIEEASLLALLETMGDEQPGQPEVDTELERLARWMRGLLDVTAETRIRED